MKDFLEEKLRQFKEENNFWLDWRWRRDVGVFSVFKSFSLASHHSVDSLEYSFFHWKLINCLFEHKVEIHKNDVLYI